MIDYEVYITPIPKTEKFSLKLIINKELIVDGLEYSDYKSAAVAAEDKIKSFIKG